MVVGKSGTHQVCLPLDLLLDTPGRFSSSVPKETPLEIFFLSYANVSATSSTAAISGPRNSTEPAFFAFAASVELKSSTIGMVHVVPLTSLPEDMTDSKSACPKNPSSGLNIPSAIFSISLWIDAAKAKNAGSVLLRGTDIAAVLDVAETFAYDKKKMSKGVFRTDDEKHPGDARVNQMADTLAVSLTFAPPSAGP